MTPEIIAIVTVGVALAGVILTSARGVRQDINELRGEVGTLRERHCQVDEKVVDRPPRYWAPARREPAMLGIRNGRQPQLDCEHHSAACRGRSVTLVGAGGWWPDPQLD